MSRKSLAGASIGYGKASGLRGRPGWLLAANALRLLRNPQLSARRPARIVGIAETACVKSRPASLRAPSCCRLSATLL